MATTYVSVFGIVRAHRSDSTVHGSRPARRAAVHSTRTDRPEGTKDRSLQKIWDPERTVSPQPVRLFAPWFESQFRPMYSMDVTGVSWCRNFVHICEMLDV